MWGCLHSGKVQHKPEVSPGSGHTRQANTPFNIRNPGLRRMYGFIICGQWHTWSSLPSNYTGYRWIVLRYVGALEFCLFCLLKTKLKSKCRNAISDFSLCECVSVCVSKCAGVITGIWQSLHLFTWPATPSLLMTQCRILGKFGYTRGPIFKVVLEC